MPPAVALVPPTLNSTVNPAASAFLVAVRVRPPDAVTRHYTGHEHRHHAGAHLHDSNIISLERGPDGRPSLHVQHYVPTALGMSAARAASVEPHQRRAASRTQSYTRSVSSTRSSEGRQSTHGNAGGAGLQQPRPTTPGQRRARGDTASRANATAVRATETTFEFDMCFVPPPPNHFPLPNDGSGRAPPLFTDSSQRAVHDAVGAPTVDHLLRGYNTCVMAYGQTGSGKTFTMLGPGWDDVMTKWSPARQRAASERAELVACLAASEDRGLMLRTCELMFQRLKQAEENEAVRLEVMRAVWADLLSHDDISTAAGSPRLPPSTASATAGGSRTTTPASTPRYHTKQHLPSATQQQQQQQQQPPPAQAAVRPQLSTAAGARASSQQQQGRAGAYARTQPSQHQQQRRDPHHLHHHSGGTGGKSPDDVFGEVIKRSVSQHRTDDDGHLGGETTPTDIPPAEYETAFETRHDKRSTMRRQPWYTAGALSTGSARPTVEMVSDDSDAEDFVTASPQHAARAATAAPSTTPTMNRGKVASSPQRRLSSSANTIPFVSPAKTEASVNVSACTDDEDEGGESAPNAPVPAVPPQPHPATVTRLPAPLQRMASTASAASVGTAATDGAAGYMNSPSLSLFDPSLYEEDVQVVVSFYQIYNEKVWCLLRPNNTPLKVREHAAIGTYVEDLFHVNVCDYDALLHAVEAGNRSRRVAATVHNRQSSRSHAIFSVQVMRRLRLAKSNAAAAAVDEDGQPLERPWMHMMSSVLNLVDLAGSERVGGVEGVTPQRWKEATDINSSLTALAKVIQALSDKHRSGGGASTFVPYRESALTWLLRDCFGGNARTVMLATISPEMKDVEETLNTLRYSSRARRIVNRPVVNGQTAKNQAAVIASLQREIIVLRAQLASYATVNPGAAPTTAAEAQHRFHGVPASLHGNIDPASASAVRSAATVDSSEEQHRLRARLEESERLMLQMTSPPSRHSTPVAGRAVTPRRSEIVLSLSPPTSAADAEASKAAALAAMHAQKVQLESLEEQVRQYKTATHRLDEQIGALRRTLETNWAAREAAATSRSLAEDAELDRRLGSAEPLLGIFDDIPAAGVSTVELPAAAVVGSSTTSDSITNRQAPAAETSRTTSVSQAEFSRLHSNNNNNSTTIGTGDDSVVGRRDTSLMRGPVQTPAHHVVRPAAAASFTYGSAPSAAPVSPGGPGGHRSSQPAQTTGVPRPVGQQQQQSRSLSSKSLLYSDDEDEAPSLRRPSWAVAGPSNTNGASPTRRTAAAQGPVLHTSQRRGSSSPTAVALQHDYQPHYNSQPRELSHRRSEARGGGSPKPIDLAAHQRARRREEDAAAAAAATAARQPGPAHLWHYEQPAAHDASQPRQQASAVTAQSYARYQSTASLATTTTNSTTSADDTTPEATPELLDLSAALRPRGDAIRAATMLRPTAAPAALPQQQHRVDPHAHEAQQNADVVERRAAARLSSGSTATAAPSAGEPSQQGLKAKPRASTPRSVGFVEPLARTPTATSTHTAGSFGQLPQQHYVDEQQSSLEQRRAAVAARMKQLDAILADDPSTPVRVGGFSGSAVRRQVELAATSPPPPQQQQRTASPHERHAPFATPPPARSADDLLRAGPQLVAPLWTTPAGVPRREEPTLRRPPASPQPGKSPTSPSLSHRRAPPPLSTGSVFAPRRQGSPEPAAMPPPPPPEPSTPEEARQRAQERFTRIMNKMNAVTTHGTAAATQPR